jgi:hypothetical protein
MVILEKIEDGTLTQTDEGKQRPHLQAMKTHYKHKSVCNMQFIEILVMHRCIYIFQNMPDYTTYNNPILQYIIIAYSHINGDDRQFSNVVRY